MIILSSTDSNERTTFGSVKFLLLGGWTFLPVGSQWIFTLSFNNAWKMQAGCGLYLISLTFLSSLFLTALVSCMVTCTGYTLKQVIFPGK